jgi:hypothetical protein
MRTTLGMIRYQSQLRPVSKMEITPGSEGLARQAAQSQEDLHVTIGGEPRKVFIYGVDNPDDTETDFYIP